MLTVTAARVRLARVVPAPPAPVGVSLEAYRAHVLARLREYEITPVWTRPSAMPPGAAAYANIRAKRIVCPPMEDEGLVAVVLHEAGHVLAEVGRGGSHYK